MSAVNVERAIEFHLVSCCSTQLLPVPYTKCKESIEKQKSNNQKSNNQKLYRAIFDKRSIRELIQHAKDVHQQSGVNAQC